MPSKTVCAGDAVSVIRDGDTVAVSGFVGIGTPDELLIALENRFLETGHPRDLTLVFAAAPGDGKDRGLNRLAHDGLVKRAIGGHWALVPKLAKMAMENKIEAYNLPLGCVSHLYREIAGGRPGMHSRVGLKTFVDPRLQGAKINERTTEDLIRLDVIDGEEWLFYRSFKIDVALLRATTADQRGNATMEREALKLDATSTAMAAHNSDGVVIVQVERVAVAGSLAPKKVLIPGVFVDCVVVAKPENHPQTYATAHNHAFSGELRVPSDEHKPMKLDQRKIVARRAAIELPIDGVVNLGIGMPEGVANVAAEEGLLDHVTLTAEPGVIGGMPQGGLDFGAALNPDAIIQQATQFDFYDGGGIDMACLGMAEADRAGNVNVSKFGPRFAGAGGFINISQNAARLVFAGTFTAGGLKVEAADGKLTIVNEGRSRKFVSQVEHITFSGPFAAEKGQPVLYVTERCVFEVQPERLALIEVAPGIDIDRDILAHMDFEPAVDDPKLMDERLFRPERMGLRSDFLEPPLEKRVAFDEERDLLEINLRGYVARTQADLDEIRRRVEAVCDPLGRKIRMVAWYDGFDLHPDLTAAFGQIIADMEEKYYHSTMRYTRSPFLRMRFGAELAKRDVSMRINSDAIETRPK
ncbi:acyl CoA:acetate/3-ketoacid CoA transferase [Fulvimarina sp. MAC3]|uniref:acyl CoA:acetate/3-ketoacid CoA transferase n=1 Tax=Fulvimarina sp. MAC3 TaxID=3148887 RepID=UPI0031FC6C83